mgnify:CR=1 FL=1
MGIVPIVENGNARLSVMLVLQSDHRDLVEQMSRQNADLFENDYLTDAVCYLAHGIHDSLLAQKFHHLLPMWHNQIEQRKTALIPYVDDAPHYNLEVLVLGLH